MKIVTSTLYAEGTTDDRFLPTIIQRSIKSLLFKNQVNDVDVFETTPLSRVMSINKALEEKIVDAAQQSRGCHLFFVHQDADSGSLETCMRDRIEPAKARILELQDLDLPCLVPIVPIRAVEAWVICDKEALTNVIGTNVSLKQIDMPNRPREAEKVLDPKEKYVSIIKSMLAGRRKIAVSPGTYYSRLADEISLEALLQLSSFQRFYSDLDVALREQHFYR